MARPTLFRLRDLRRAARGPGRSAGTHLATACKPRRAATIATPSRQVEFGEDRDREAGVERGDDFLLSPRSELRASTPCLPDRVLQEQAAASGRTADRARAERARPHGVAWSVRPPTRGARGTAARRCFPHPVAHDGEIVLALVDKRRDSATETEVHLTIDGWIAAGNSARR